jgi:hypothetical protein
MMFEGDMFFQPEGLAMEAPINGDTFVFVERNTDIHDMLNEFDTSIRLHQVHLSVWASAYVGGEGEEEGEVLTLN